MMAVEIELGGRPRVASPQRLFSDRYQTHFGNGIAQYDLALDGRTVNEEPPASNRLRLLRASP